MKLTWVVGLLAGTMMAGSAAAQTNQGQVPAGEAALGAITLQQAVLADGQPLAAGAYDVRLTAQRAQPSVAGQQLERWAEFLQAGQVKGREVVSIVPAGEMKDLNSGLSGPKPAAGKSRVDLLKGNEYVRVWINAGGVNYLIHMPPTK
jgi:hypothetical protein